VGDAQVKYLPHDSVTFGKLRKLVIEVSPDIIYLNSFFDPLFTQKIMVLVRLGFISRNVTVILAPRGEFSSGALQLKCIKKNIFILLVQWLGIYDRLIWQASSEMERRDILDSRLGIKPESVVIAMNLTSSVTELPSKDLHRDNQGILKICFLSRIVPKKNLDYVLGVMSMVSAPTALTIYGPKEDASYWRACEALIHQLPKHIQVNLGGEVHPSQINESLAQHDLFFFPTRGENYGHVIHEALSAGLPVLLSDQTPWQEVVAKDIGWCFPLESRESFVSVIEDVATWGFEMRVKTAEKAQRYALEMACSDTTLDANRQLFSLCLGSSTYNKASKV